MKKKIIIGVVILVAVIVLGLGTISYQNSNGYLLSKADRILESYKQGKLEGGIAMEMLLNIKEDVQGQEVKDEVQDKMSYLSDYNNIKVILEEAREKMANNTLTDVGYGIDDKSKYIELIYDKLEDDTDAEIYEEAMAVLMELKNYGQNTIELGYTKIDSNRIKIEVVNNTERDINYIRVDFFEMDSEGNVVGSDWTNTSAIIKAGGGKTYIETYYDFTNSFNGLQLEANDVRYR